MINVMRWLAGLDWGAHVASLKQRYIALIQSRIDNRCVEYDSVAKSVLSDLDVRL